MRNHKVICTIGPSCNNKKSLIKLKDAGVDIFRVNMSHANIEDIYRLNEIALDIGITLGVDTEGAQIRTKLNGKNKITLEKNKKIIINLNPTKNKSSLNLYPEEVLDKLIIGDNIRLDFNGASVTVIHKDDSKIEFLCTSPGEVGDNKGADLQRKIDLPDFTKKDLKALKIANELEINEIFISFCKSKKAIDTVRRIVSKSFITSKIESRLSINRLPIICHNSDAILIDRGDLSREISILDIPFAQRGIISVALKNKIPCYVATNVLESLIKEDLPTKAELNDIVSTIEMGASGIVLAAETAIGKNPILCAEIVKELLHKNELHNSGLLFADVDRNEITDKRMRMWLNR